ncbi:DeoR faimly transcriptional regulator [Paenibacillus swuensis]|uniref:DeoR faimly transcriptional regulator n=1 Tax=Paenibacillus swuensis TaxID=1178515 RepID=A0A172TK49_9BACL|nr:DeoR/GlpR family DNA-binding transcription regulator [Paenibacillus swuensis]ANE47294.1 DeoR faimly transcriptional regulator [Paenibacillus swuensis]
MYQEERIQAILSHMAEYGRVNIGDICTLFEVSRDTARRDLVKMDELGLIIRTHGGAVLPLKPKEIYPYKDRLTRESTGKINIGRYAASLIEDGDTVILDASTTVQYAAERITSLNVTAVTNSIDIADTLSGKDNVRTYLLGGELHPRHRFLYGPATIAKLAEYRADKLLLGAGAIAEEGLFFPYEDEGFVKREMIRRAKQVILLADHTKFDKSMFFKIADLEAVSLMITDLPPKPDMMNYLEQHQIELIIVSEENTHDKNDSK